MSHQATCPKCRHRFPIDFARLPERDREAALRDLTVRKSPSPPPVRIETIEGEGGDVRATFALDRDE